MSYIIDSWLGGSSPCSQRYYRVCCLSLDTSDYYIETRLLSDPDEDAYYRHASPSFEHRVIALLRADLDQRRDQLAKEQHERERFVVHGA